MAQHGEPVPGGLGSPMDSQAGARVMVRYAHLRRRRDFHGRGL
jgi:hypothetical protein